jgi:hypothetical protein
MVAPRVKVAEHTKLVRALKPMSPGLRYFLSLVAEHTKLVRALKLQVQDDVANGNGLVAEHTKLVRALKLYKTTGGYDPHPQEWDQVVAEHTKLVRALKRVALLRVALLRVALLRVALLRVGRRTHKAREGTETLSTTTFRSRANW